MNDLTTVVLLLDNNTNTISQPVDLSGLLIGVGLLLGYVLYVIFIVGRR